MLENGFLERNIMLEAGATPERCELYKEAIQTLTHPQTHQILNLENYLSLVLGGGMLETARVMVMLRKEGVIEQLDTHGWGAANHLWLVHLDK